jgi:hypothetical protein
MRVPSGDLIAAARRAVGLTQVELAKAAGIDAKQHLTAIAIVFDFVKPVLPYGRLIDRGSKLGLDESEAGSYAKHGGFVVGGRSLGKGGWTGTASAVER